MKIINKVEEVTEKIAYLVFLYGLCLVNLLYVENNYFNMMEAKRNCFEFIYKYLIVLLIILLFLQIITKKFKKLCLLDYFVIFFIVSAFFSMKFSFSSEYAYSGYQGWYVGFKNILYLGLTYLVLRSCKPLKWYFYLPNILVICFIGVITIIQASRYDVFSLRANILDSNYFTFFSTIGNSNWYVGFLSVILPIFIGLYLKEKDRIKLIVLFIINGILLFNVLIINADVIYICFLIMCFLYAKYILSSKDKIYKFLSLMIVFSIEILLHTNLKVFHNHLFYMNGLSLKIMNNWVGIFLLVVCILLILFITKIDEERFKKCSFNINKIVKVFFVIFVLGFIFYYLKSDISFGSYRKLIYQESLDAYMNSFNIKQKIFGLGEELVRNIYSGITLVTNQIVTVSHSEFIQLLLSNGILGLISYIGIYISIIYLFYKEKRNLICFVSIMSYVSQAIFNSALLVNLSLLVLVVLLFCQNDNQKS